VGGGAEELMVERYSMLGIGEKDVMRCRRELKSILVKILEEGVIVRGIEIWSQDEEGEGDVPGSCYVKWDLDLSA